jgi:hypothetical protein
MNTYKEVEKQLRIFLRLVLDVDEWLAARSGRFTLRGRAAIPTGGGAIWAQEPSA